MFGYLYAKLNGSGFKYHYERQRLTSLSQESFLTFKFVRLFLTFLDVCDTYINQQPVSSSCYQKPPINPKSYQQIATGPNRLYSLDLLHCNQCLIMLFTRECLLSNTSCGAGCFEPPISSTMKKYIFGAAKKFSRHEYEYEYIMYIDYTRTYIKYQHIMYSMFVTYVITYVA